MIWSDLFKAYIDKRFGDGAQQKAAFALKVSPSKVSYWCRGSVPREKTRKRIARWSEGAVPAEAANDAADRPVDKSNSDAA